MTVIVAVTGIVTSFGSDCKCNRDCDSVTVTAILTVTATVAAVVL